MPKVCRCSFDLKAIIRSVLLITVAAPFFCPPWEPNDRSWLGWATIPPNGGVMVRPRGQAATTICLLGNPGVGDGRDGVAEAQAQHKKKITRAWHGFGAIGERFGFVIRRWRFWNPDLSFHLGTGASHKRKAHVTV